MARILDALPNPSGSGGGQKYPLDDWFDGRVWELTAGEDFTTSLKNVRTTLATTAASRGLKLATRKTSETTLAVQATPISKNGQKS